MNVFFSNYYRPIYSALSSLDNIIIVAIRLPCTLYISQLRDAKRNVTSIKIDFKK